MKFLGKETWRMLEGHALEQLRLLPEASVHCVVTSPPYFGLRKYPGADVMWSDGWEGQLGLEPTPDLYVQHLIAVLEEVRRVLRNDGTLWLNLGDSYANDGKWGGTSGGRHGKELHGATSIGRERRSTGLQPKNSHLGIGCFYCPQRITVAFRKMANRERARIALEAHGWMLAVNPDGDGGVLMDPVCHECGLGLMRSIIERGGGAVAPEAAKSIRRLFPELADELGPDTN